MKFCTNCGNELAEDVKFCTSCGNPSQKEMEEEISSEIIDKTGANEQSEEIVEESVVQTDAPSEETERRDKTQQEQHNKEGHQQLMPAQQREQASEVKQGQTATVHQGQQTTEVQQPVSPPAKKSMSKRNKILLGTVAAIIILLFGVHKYLESHFDPMKQVVAMENALSEKKMGEFFNLIELEEDALIDKESYFDYIRKNEW